MKKLFVVLCLLCASFTYAVSAHERYFQGVIKRLEAQEIKLTSDVPDALAQAYHDEIQEIKDQVHELSWTYYGETVASDARRAVRTLLNQQFKPLVRDHDLYLAQKKSAYLISSIETSLVESEVLQYQHAFLDVVEKWLQNALQERTDEVTFAFSLKNSEIVAQVSSPRIVSKTDIGGGKQSVEIELAMNAEFLSQNLIGMSGKVSGTVKIRVVTAPGALYVALDDVTVTATGDSALVAAVEGSLQEIQDFKKQLDGRFLKIPMTEDVLAMNSPALIKKTIEVLRSHALFTPRKKVSSSVFTLKQNLATLKRIALVYGVQPEEIYLPSFRLDIDTTNGAGKMGVGFDCKKECWYLTRRDGRVGFVGKDTGVDVRADRIGYDLKVHIIDGEESVFDVIWQDDVLKFDAHLSSWNDGERHSLSISGPLSRTKASLKIVYDAVDRGTFDWSLGTLDQSFGLHLSLWDSYKTQIDYTVESKGTLGDVTVTEPTNVILESELYPAPAPEPAPAPIIYPSGELTKQQISDLTKDSPRLKLGKTQKDAPIILLFSDIECPYCTQLIQTLDLAHPRTFSFSANLYYKHYPLVFHTNATSWSQKSICEYRAGGARSFYDALAGHASQSDRPYEDFLQTSEVDIKKCLDDNTKSKTLDDIIARDQKDAEYFAVSGTPSSVIINPTTGHYVIVGGAVSLVDFEHAVSQAMAE